MTITLTESEQVLILNALVNYARTSDESAEACDGNDRLVAQFQRQAAECRELADRFEA